MPSSARRIRLLVFLLCWGSSARAAGPAGPNDTSLRKIGEMELAVVGLTATVEPQNPVVPKNVASAVRVVLRGGGGEISAADAERWLGSGFEVRAELSGPGLRQTLALPLKPDPSDPLLLPLPPLEISGDYRLSNLRLVSEGKPVVDVSPREVVVQVIEQVLVTSVTTRPLTLDELKARGVVLDSDDYLGFEFSLGLMLESKPVQIDFPVVFDRQGVAVPQPLLPPPAPERTAAALPALPAIVPLLLEVEGGGQQPRFLLPNGKEVEVRIPSLLVFPGSVAFLKQFFSAQLFVANGAPAGSGLSVRELHATISLPPGELSLPETAKGPGLPTLPVLGLGPDGAADTGDEPERLAPGEQGQAEFLLRGEKLGFHNIGFDIEGLLDGLPLGPVKVKGKTSGGVLVRTPAFDLAFSVPAVARAGEIFKLFVTVTNIGEAFASDVRVRLDGPRLSGAHLLNPADSEKSIDHLDPNDSRALEFLLESERTGKVVASYLDFEGGPEGAPPTGRLSFTLAVGERGVPLSPDTLVLPASVDQLPPSLTRAAMRVLGQAWSVANAPPGTLPRGVKRISRAVATEKALALAEAGLRVSLGESLPQAAADLMFDFYGGTPLDAGWDQLLRETRAGWDFAQALGSELLDPAPGGPLALEQEISRRAASGPDFIAFAVGGPVEVHLRDGSGRESVSGVAPEALPLSKIPGAALVPLGNPESAPILGILTVPTSSPYTLEILGRAVGTTGLAVSFPRGDGGFHRVEVNDVPVTKQSRSRLVVDLSRPDALTLEEDPEGDGSFVLRPLVPVSFSAEGPLLLSANVIGPESLDGAAPFGLQVALLFDRIVEAQSASDKSKYEVPSNAFRTVKRQLTGRLVFGTLELPEGPYILTTVTARGIRDLRGVARGELKISLRSRLEDPGAVVSGRVFHADGTPVSSGLVTYLNQTNLSCAPRFETGLAAASLSADGRYELRYVRQDPCGSPFSVLTQDATGAVRKVTAFVRGPGEQIVLDIALTGRGSVTGLVLDHGEPAPGASVVVRSGTDPQSGASATTDGEGRYFVSGITVGPVAVRAARGALVGAGAGRIFRAGTTETVNVNLEGGGVRVAGKVSRLEGTETFPIAGIPVIFHLLIDVSPGEIPVGVTQTSPDGSYVLQDLPAGSFRIEAALNSRDRASLTGFAPPGADLRDRNLIIEIKAAEHASVSGTVRLPNGDQAPGVIVAIGDRGVLSGEGGRYTIPGVAVSPAPQTVAARTRDGRRSGSRSVLVTQPGQQLEGVDITLSGLGGAEFTVLDSKNLPVKGQVVALLSSCNSPCGCEAQTTDDAGKARFTNLPLGTARARALLFGSDFTDVAEGVASVTAEGPPGIGLLRFTGVGKVTGTVFEPDGDRAHGAEVLLHGKVFNPFSCTLVPGISHRVRTSLEGEFEFTGVNLGQVSVTANFFGASAGAQGTLTTPDQVLPLTIRLPETTSGELSGTVFLPDGARAAGPGVELTAIGPLPEVTARTDAGGVYRFAPGLPQGPYTLTALDSATGGLARVSVFLQAGRSATHDLRLKGRGKVRVRVVGSDNAPVENAFVRLTETEFPARVYEAAVEPATQGVATFANVFEGPLSVEVSALGQGARASAVLPGPDAEIEVKVRLGLVGRVQGHFLMPDGKPIPFGVVKLIAGGKTIGQVTTLGAGDVGFFAFDQTPGGDIRLDGFDPLTARAGVAAGTLDGPVLTLDVRASGLGTVEGLVTANSQPTEARVEVVSGNYRAVTFSGTDGFYRVEGVPEGHVVVTASLGNGFLSGTASKTLIGEGPPLRIDVALRDTGEVEGQVLPAVGEGPAPISLVTIQVGGPGGGSQSTTTDAEGRFRFERVPSGEATLAVEALGSIDVGRATFEVPPAGKKTVAIRLNGVGSITGEARRGADPVAGNLTIQGTGPFPYNFRLVLAPDGSFRLPEVLAGPFTATVRASIDGGTLYGTASGAVQPNLATHVVVSLEPSGTVTGLVRRSNGDAAPGAEVTLQTARGVVRYPTDATGRFTARGVPLGTFNLRVSDPFTSGLARVDGLTLDREEPPLELEPIPLDDSPNTATIFPDGTAGPVPPDASILVRFTDSVEPGSIPGNIEVRANGAPMPMRRTLSADGLALSVEVIPSLPPRAAVEVRVKQNLQDRLGRKLVADVVGSFATSGTVLHGIVSSSGQPVEGAQVQLTSAAVSRTPVLTSSTGFYRFEDLPAGTVGLQATLGDKAGSAVRDLGPGEGVVSLNLALTTTGVISGQVQRWDGFSAGPGLEVRILQSGVPVAFTTTGDNGTYSVSAVPLFPFAVDVSDPATGDRGRNTGNFASDRTALVNVTLLGVGAVRVLVKDGSNRAVDRVKVSLSFTRFGQLTRYEGVTGSDGVVEFNRVLTGAFSVEATDPASDAAGSAGGQAMPDQTVALEVVLQLNPVSLPARLLDANGAEYHVQASGALSGGRNNVFGTDNTERGLHLDVNVSATTRFSGPGGSPPKGSQEQSGREVVVAQPALIEGLFVQRKVFVPTEGYFARYLESFENRSDAPVSFSASLVTRLKRVDGPQAVIETAGPWLIVDDSDKDPFQSFSAPTTAWVLGAEPPADLDFNSLAFDDRELVVHYPERTLAPGQRVILMHFVSQQLSREAARAAAERLVSLPPEALQGLSTREISEIVNFSVPAGGASALAPLPRLTGRLDGRVLAHDASHLIPFDIVSSVKFQSRQVLFRRVHGALTSLNSSFSLKSQFDAFQSIAVPRTDFTLSASARTGATGEVEGRFSGEGTPITLLTRSPDLKVTASSFSGPGTEPEKAVDGFTCCDWISKPSDTLPTLEITFPGPVEVRQIDLDTRPIPNERIERVQIDLIRSGGAPPHTEFADLPDEGDIEIRLADAVPGVVGVRVRMISFTGSVVRVTELRVLGVPTSDVGATTRDVVFVGTGAIEGTVRKFDGTPARSQVTFSGKGGSFTLSELTDTSGFIFFAPIPPSASPVTVTATPFPTQNPLLTASRPVDVRPNETSIVPDFRYPETAKVEGRVVSLPTGVGLANRFVQLFRDEDRNGVADSSGDQRQTKSDGSFVFEEVPDGKYTLRVSESSRAVNVFITVDAPTPVRQDIEVPNIRTVTLTVYFEGEPAVAAGGAPVSKKDVLDTAFVPVNSTSTVPATLGKLDIPNLAGSFTLLIRHPRNFDSVTEVSGSASDTNIVARIPAFGTVKGLVRANDVAVGGAPVSLIGIAVPDVFSFSSGYQFLNVPARRPFKVRALHPRSDRRHIFSESDAFTEVPADGATVSVNLDLPLTASVTVKVEEAQTIEPVQGADIFIKDSFSSDFRPEGPTSFGGTRLIPVVPRGVFLLRAEKNGRLLAEGQGEVVSTSPMTIVLTKPLGATVEGLVRAADAETPVQFARVELRSSDGLSVIQSAETDRSGKFRFTKTLDPGTSVRVRANFFGRTSEQSVTATEFGERLEVVFDLPIAVVKGRVLEFDGSTPVSNASVELAREGSLFLEDSTQTDTTGKFFFLDPSPGAFELTAEDSFGLVGRARAVLPSDPLWVERDILMPEFGSLEVSVTDADGNPLGNAPVVLSSATLRRPRVQSVDGNGDSRFDRVALGSFSLTYDEPTGEFDANEREITVPAWAVGRLSIGGETAAASLTLPRLGSVSGRVLPDAPEGSRATLEGRLHESKAGIYHRPLPLQPDGTFEQAGVPEGEVTVTVESGAEAGAATATLVGSATIDVVRASAVALPAPLGPAGGIPHLIHQDGALEGERDDGPAVFVSFLTVNGKPYSALASARGELSGRQVVLGPIRTGGLAATRKVFVPEGAPFARYLEILENSTPVDIDVTLNLSGSLPTLLNGAVREDRTFSAELFSGTGAAFVFAGEGEVRLPDALRAEDETSSYEIEWRSIRVPAGSRVMFLHFVVQAADESSAAAMAASLLDLSHPDALTGLSAELPLILNFRVGR